MHADICDYWSCEFYVGILFLIIVILVICFSSNIYVFWCIHTLSLILGEYVRMVHRYVYVVKPEGKFGSYVKVFMCKKNVTLWFWSLYHDAYRNVFWEQMGNVRFGETC